MTTHLAIAGMGSYLPRLMHTNETLPPLDKPVTQEELDRIGVVRRGWAGDGEGIAEMAAEASRRAITEAGIDAASLDVIVLANWTQRRFIPEFAPRLQRLIGAPQAFAFDVSGACTGFAIAVSIADGYLKSPRLRRALVVASETTSQRGRPTSKSTLVFGDAAGAWVLERRDGEPRGARVIDWEIITDGAHHDIMTINEAGHVCTHMPQKELNQLAARSFATASARVLQRNRLTLADVDWIVPHSGTAGIQATLIKTLEVPAHKVLSNFSTVGNVSSAAIPVALEEFVRAGQIKPGALVLSPTTGTGWYAAALLYRV
ncbi:MAG: ketoacyl-ACP synthase III [Myxococcales bacterium]|nr:ketoacyl-ACP synthase III [Myxococcales bacterium]